jgi:DNA-binding transcriptional regulator YiaG
MSRPFRLRVLGWNGSPDFDDPCMSISANATDRSGDLLRTARKAAGLSQQRVAELAGCSVSYVRVLESGYRPENDSDVLVRIADVLNHESPAGEPGSREISAGQGRHGSG